MFECSGFNQRENIRRKRKIKKDGSADEINKSLFIDNELFKLYTTIYNLSQDN